MNPRQIRIAAAVAGLGLAVPLILYAQSSSLAATPRFTAVGVASSGSQTTAWFHEPGGKVMACQTTGQGAGAQIHCTTIQLP
jgi:hypothetical protein